MNIGDTRTDAWRVEWVILGVAWIVGEALLLIERVNPLPGQPPERRGIRSGTWETWNPRRVSEPEGAPVRTAQV